MFRYIQHVQCIWCDRDTFHCIGSFQVHPDGKFVVDLDKSIEMSQVTPNLRVALRNDSYTLHKILPSKIDPLVSLMMVEKVPDSTYDMVGGLDKQIKEIKEVWTLKMCTVHCICIIVYHCTNNMDSI